MFRRIVAGIGMGVLASLMACSSGGRPGAAQTEQTPLRTQTVTALNVNFGSVIQSNFLGLGATYHGFSYMPESNAQGMTDALRTIEFDRVDRMKLNIARTWYGSDWAMPTWGGAYDWNSTKMTAFYQWLQAMKDRNVQVALNVGWWFTEHTCSSDAPTNCTPQVPTDVNVYTKWVSDSLNQLVNVKGFTNIKYAILFTEPLTYCGCGGIPSGYTQKTYYWYVTQQLHNRLVGDGRRNLVKLVGPNTNDIENPPGKAAVQDSVSNINPYLDAYSFHTYNMDGYDGWSAAVNNGLSAMSATGKPFWFDEYGKQDEAYRSTADYGTYLAEANAAVLNAGGQTSLIWLYQDQYYVYPLNTITNGDSFSNGLHKWGTMPWLPTSTAVRPAWLSFAMMTRFLGTEGTKIVDTSKSVNGVRISAVQLPDGNVTVMVINSNTASADINIGFTSTLGKTLWRHLYDPSAVPQGDSIIGASKEFSSVNTSLTDNLPSRSVAIYTSIDDGTRPSLSSNLALGATLSASSSVEFSNWGLAKVNDGQTSSIPSSNGWSSDASTTVNHTESVQFALGSLKTVGRVDIYPRNEVNNIGQGFPIDFTIDTSQDAANWTTVISRSGFVQPANNVQSFSFNSVQARYVRIRGTSLRPNPTDSFQYRMQFAEVEIYADAGSGNLLSVANSSFESPSVATIAYNPTGATWIFSSNNAGLQRNGSAFGATNAPDGVQTAFLQGSNGGLGSISQSVNFPAGTFTLTFQVARRNGQIQPIKFSVDGLQVGTNITPSSDSFSSYTSASFTVSAGNHILKLEATVSGGDETSFIDQVSINNSAPPTASMFLNPSLETPTINGLQYSPSGADWTFGGLAGIQRDGSAFGAANAPDGVQTAFIQGSGAGLGNMAQTLSLSAGTYTLSFKTARRIGQIQPIKISVDGTQVGGLITPSSDSFSSYTSSSFTVTAGNHTVKLEATDSSGDKTSFVDALTLQ